MLCMFVVFFFAPIEFDPYFLCLAVVSSRLDVVRSDRRLKILKIKCL